MAPTSSGVQARPNGSGLNNSRQFSASPVRSCAFFFIKTDQPFGLNRTGIDRDDADAVLRADAAQ